jgi:hypothetical protein
MTCFCQQEIPSSKIFSFSAGRVPLQGNGARTFPLIAAVLALIDGPFGIALGVFTIVMVQGLVNHFLDGAEGAMPFITAVGVDMTCKLPSATMRQDRQEITRRIIPSKKNGRPCGKASREET